MWRPNFIAIVLLLVAPPTAAAPASAPHPRRLRVSDSGTQSNFAFPLTITTITRASSLVWNGAASPPPPRPPASSNSNKASPPGSPSTSPRRPSKPQTQTRQGPHAPRHAPRSARAIAARGSVWSLWTMGSRQWTRQSRLRPPPSLAPKSEAGPAARDDRPPALHEHGPYVINESASVGRCVRPSLSHPQTMDESIDFQPARPATIQPLWHMVVSSCGGIIYRVIHRPSICHAAANEVGGGRRTIIITLSV